MTGDSPRADAPTPAGCVTRWRPCRRWSRRSAGSRWAWTWASRRQRRRRAERRRREPRGPGGVPRAPRAPQGRRPHRCAGRRPPLRRPRALAARGASAYRLRSSPSPVTRTVARSAARSTATSSARPRSAGAVDHALVGQLEHRRARVGQPGVPPPQPDQGTRRSRPSGAQWTEVVRVRPAARGGPRRRRRAVRSWPRGRRPRRRSTPRASPRRSSARRARASHPRPRPGWRSASRRGCRRRSWAGSARRTRCAGPGRRRELEQVGSAIELQIAFQSSYWVTPSIPVRATRSA